MTYLNKNVFTSWNTLLSNLNSSEHTGNGDVYGGAKSSYTSGNPSATYVKPTIDTYVESAHFPPATNIANSQRDKHGDQQTPEYRSKFFKRCTSKFVPKCTPVATPEMIRNKLKDIEKQKKILNDKIDKLIVDENLSNEDQKELDQLMKMFNDLKRARDDLQKNLENLKPRSSDTNIHGRRNQPLDERYRERVGDETDDNLSTKSLNDDDSNDHEPNNNKSDEETILPRSRDEFISHRRPGAYTYDPYTTTHTQLNDTTDKSSSGLNADDGLFIAEMHDLILANLTNSKVPQITTDKVINKIQNEYKDDQTKRKSVAAALKEILEDDEGNDIIKGSTSYARFKKYLDDIS